MTHPFGEEPHLDLKTTEGEVRMDRFNGSLYTFVGELALYNHVFVQTTDDEDGQSLGTYIFNQNPTFKTISEFMVHHRFPMFLNLVRVPPCDRQAWNYASLADLNMFDSFPEEWESR